MVITYQGIESFKVQFGDTVLAFNPISKNSKHKASSFGSDVALISINHPDMNGSEQASRGENQPFVVSGAGEYEIKDVAIRGFGSISDYGKEKSINTIYLVELEGIRLCFLGALNLKELDSKTVEELDGIDVLFIPIGGNGVLDAASAYKLATSLEPKIIIPMHYGNGLSNDALKLFIKEGGKEKLEETDRLTIKKKDLDGREGDIIVLKSI